MGNIPGLAVGGTGTNAASSFGAMPYVASGGEAYAHTAVGTSGYFLQSTGAGAPGWLNLLGTNNIWTTQQNFRGKLHIEQTGETLGLTPKIQFATVGTDRAYIQGDRDDFGGLALQTSNGASLHLNTTAAGGRVLVGTTVATASLSGDIVIQNGRSIRTAPFRASTRPL